MCLIWVGYGSCVIDGVLIVVVLVWLCLFGNLFYDLGSFMVIASFFVLGWFCELLSFG